MSSSTPSKVALTFDTPRDAETKPTSPGTDRALQLQRYREFHRQHKKAQLAKAKARAKLEVQGDGELSRPSYDKSRPREWRDLGSGSGSGSGSGGKSDRPEEDSRSGLQEWLIEVRLEALESRLMGFGVECEADLKALDDNYIDELKQGLNPVQVSRLNRVLGILSPSKVRSNKVAPLLGGSKDNNEADEAAEAAAWASRMARNAAADVAEAVSSARGAVEFAMQRAVAAAKEDAARKQAAKVAAAEQAANEQAASQLRTMNPQMLEFKALDMDGDGFITKKDQLALWQRMGMDVTSQAIQQRMNRQWSKLDPENKGAVDFPSFVAAKSQSETQLELEKQKQQAAEAAEAADVGEAPAAPSDDSAAGQEGGVTNTSPSSLEPASKRRGKRGSPGPWLSKGRRSSRGSSRSNSASNSPTNVGFKPVASSDKKRSSLPGEDVDVKPLPKRKEKTKRPPTDSTVMKCLASFKDLIDDYGYQGDEFENAEQATSAVINTITPLVTVKEKVYKGIMQCNSIISNATYMLLIQMFLLAALAVLLQRETIGIDDYWTPPDWLTTAIAGLVFVLRFIESVFRMQARSATARAYRAQLRGIETELDLFAVKVYGHVFEDTYEGVAHHFTWQDRASRLAQMEEKLSEYKDAAKKIEYGLLELREDNQQNFRTQIDALSLKYVNIKKEWTPRMAAADYDS